jgi:hypothetical protein
MTDESVAIKYNAPAKDSLEVEGKTIQGGDVDYVSLEAADGLLADPSIDVTIVDEGSAEDLAKRNTRPQLEELARDAGIEEPEKFSNKADLAAAIRKAMTEEPEADGAGPTDHSEEE